MNLWFTKSPHQIMKILGIQTDKRRAEDFENFIDGDISGWYYLSHSSDGTDESLKWILGPIAAYLKERKISVKQINRVLPAPLLKLFIEYMKNNKFERGYAKEILTELFDHNNRIYVNENDEIVFSNENEILNRIINNPKFKSADDSVIDEIINKIISDNKDKADKVKEQPQLLKWFVGQVMKEAKGKATGATVQQKLMQQFGV